MRLDLDRLTDEAVLAPLELLGLVKLVSKHAPSLEAQAKQCKDIGAMATLLRSNGDGVGDVLHHIHSIDRIRRQDDAEELLQSSGIEIQDKESIEAALVRAAVENRDAFEAAYDHTTVIESKNAATFVHFAPRKPLKLAKDFPTKDQREAFRKNAKRFFEEASQGPHCKVNVQTADHEIAFLIDHGTALHTEQIINAKEKKEVMSFRLPRRDVVLLNKKTGALRVNARKESERIFYAAQFSALLFAEEKVFVTTDAYSLDRICEPGFDDILREAADEEISEVVLRSLRLVSNNEFGGRHVMSSADVLGSAKLEGINLANYTADMATFGLVPKNRPEGRKGRRLYHLHVWNGDKLKYDAPWSVERAQEIVERLQLRRVVEAKSE